MYFVSTLSYDDALEIISKSPEYIDAKNNLSSEFFWEIGKYSAIITVDYGKRKKKSYTYEFSVTEQNSMDLRNNIDESLIVKLKECYRIPLEFKSPMIEISESK